MHIRSVETHFQQRSQVSMLKLSIYQASNRKNWLFCILLAVWLTELASSIARMVYTSRSSIRKVRVVMHLTSAHSRLAALSYHGIDFNATMVGSERDKISCRQFSSQWSVQWSHMSYLHLTSRLAAILGPASLRLYFPIRRHELSNARHR